MLQFLNLELDNFKCFLDFHEFNIDDFPSGLYFITGVNNIEPELGANAVGKSSLWEGLCWNLWGKSLQGIRGHHLHSWRSNNSYYSVSSLIKSDNLHIIKRIRPNNGKAHLLLDDVEVEQEEINELLHMDYDIFKYSIIIGQSCEFFFDLKPTARLDLFSKLLQLETWIERSKIASSTASALERELVEEENNLFYLEGSIHSAVEELNRNKELANSFEADRTGKLEELSHKQIELNESLDDVSKELLSRTENLDSLVSNIDNISVKVSEKKKAYDSIMQVYAGEKVNLDSSRTYVRIIRREIDSLETEQETICSKCNQLIPQTKVEELLDELLVKKEEGLNELEEKEALVNKLTLQLESLTKDLNIENNNLEDITNKKQKVDNELSSLFSLEARIEVELKYIKEQLEEESNRTNIYQELNRELNNNLKKMKKERKAIETTLKKITRKLERTEFWVKGFKNIRLFIVEEALSLLRATVNNSLHQLGLKDWLITFDIERETKAGTIAKGFDINILAPNIREQIPWEAWSGGEAQRLKLAGSLGLMDLINSYRGYFPNIEVWDEPTTHLSQQGIADLLDLLKLRAAELNKKIFVVDHHSLDYGGFSGIITVIKDNVGSRIES